MASRACIVVVAALLAAGLEVVPVHAAERVYRSEHFALTWSDDRSDPDAPDLADYDGDGVPDAVERVTRAFEDARAFLLGELGYRPPPTRGRYNLYLSAALDRGLVRPSPGGNGRSRPSFITLPTELVRASATEGEIRAFAVHEYFHAIQLGYDAGEDPWILEASSSWVEGLFGPAPDHNHVYLYDFVPRLQLGLRSEAGIHEYGAFLFLQFLTERYGDEGDRPAIVRELWEAMAVPEAVEGAPDDDSLAAIERVLGARAVALADAWREFQLWAWQLPRFEKGDLYKRALRDHDWPTAPPVTVADETCRLTANPGDDVLPALAGDFVRIRPADRARTENARVTVRGPAGATAFALVRRAGSTPIVREIAFDADGVGVLDVAMGGTGAPRMILGLGNAGFTPGTLEYSVRLGAATSVVAGPPQVPATTIYGTAVTVSGLVECGGAPAPFARVVLTRTDVASGDSEEIFLTTDAFGRWSLVVTPEVTSRFAVAVADPLLSRVSSPASTVGVRVAVNMTTNKDQVEEGEALIVEGDVAPIHSGRVVLERRRPNGQFEIASESTLDPQGRYRFEHVLPGPGVWEVRVTLPDTADDDHLPGDSAPRLIQVGQT